jgi:hypothetical protein
MDSYNQSNSSIFSMEIDEQGKSNFLEMARWTKFLAIVGFIFMGLGFVAFVMLGSATMNNMAALSGETSQYASLGMTAMIIMYIIIAALYFYPLYALLKYSTGIKTALQTNDKIKFNDAIGYLKGMFKYLGILMIICLALYGIIILFAGLGAMATGR